MCSIRFRTNEMRLNVTKVLERIVHQLQKSSTIDDPIKLIYSVMHSNDCIARALTLRFHIIVVIIIIIVVVVVVFDILLNYLLNLCCCRLFLLEHSLFLLIYLLMMSKLIFIYVLHWTPMMKSKFLRLLKRQPNSYLVQSSLSNQRSLSITINMSSRTFALSISTKLVSLIEDLTTPLTIKSWLIPLFEHMIHDATVSMKVICQ
jgi:hypothetical protein